MNDSLASQQKSKKTGGDVLSARLLYLALKCPLLQGKHCQTETVRPVEPQSARTVKPPRKDDALVELRIVLPYGLRKQAQDEHINCSALFRRALKRSLTSRRSSGARCDKWIILQRSKMRGWNLRRAWRKPCTAVNCVMRLLAPVIFISSWMGSLFV